MQYTRLKKPRADNANHAVHASLDRLIRLQARASGFSFLPRQPIHSILSGRHASRLRGRGLNFEELRNYMPGDDIRTIDWKVTARTREPHVRVYTEERDRPVWLLVDQRLSMFFGSTEKMKSVTAAEAAALAAWRVLKAGDRVGAIVFGDRDVSVVPPHRSEQRVMQILDKVVEKNHALRADSKQSANPAMLNEALRQVSAFARHDCLVALISDGYGIDGETRKLVTRLTEHNDVLSVFIYDLLERELCDSGHLVFSDGRGQLDVDTGSKKTREGFAADFRQRLERMQATSRKFAIPLMPVHTAAPVEEQVRDQIGRHQQARRF